MNFYEKLEEIEDRVWFIGNDDIRNDSIWMVNMLREQREELKMCDIGLLKVIKDMKTEIDRLRYSNDNLVNELLKINESDNNLE